MKTVKILKEKRDEIKNTNAETANMLKTAAANAKLLASFDVSFIPRNSNALWISSFSSSLIPTKPPTNLLENLQSFV